MPLALRLLAIGFTLSSFAMSASADDWVVTYELPGVQTTSATLQLGGTETFDNRALGYVNFGTSFGGSINGQFQGAYIDVAREHGGAGGQGRFATTNRNPAVFAYSLQLDRPVNYFGHWLSSLDAGNVITFYKGASMVGSFNMSQLLLPSLTGQTAYFGNPNPAFLNGWSAEAFVFVNFYRVGTLEGFDRVVLSEAWQTYPGSYDSDNHTVGLYQLIGGIALVPEPSRGAMLVIGALLVLGLTRGARGPWRAR